MTTIVKERLMNKRELLCLMKTMKLITINKNIKLFSNL